MRLDDCIHFTVFFLPPDNEEVQDFFFIIMDIKYFISKNSG